MALLVLIAFLTAERWLLLISHDGERRFVDRYVTLVKSQFLTSSDAVLQRYVEDLTLQLAQHMNPPEGLSIRVHVVKGPPNAAATLGGHIFVLEGLLHMLDNENSLAMVLAHELAHCINRDPLRSVGRGLLLEILLSSNSNAGLAGNQLLMRRYSREQERAADRDALQALQAEYGHVGGASGLFEALQAFRGGSAKSGPGRTELFSTRPAIGERIEAIEAAVGREGWSELPTRPYPDEVRAILRAVDPSETP